MMAVLVMMMMVVVTMIDDDDDDDVDDNVSKDRTEMEHTFLTSEKHLKVAELLELT